MAAQNKPKTQTYKVPRKLAKPKSDNPKWLLPTISTLLIVGTVWIVTYYVSRADYPLPIGDWNVAAGFVFMVVAMGLLTRWK